MGYYNARVFYWDSDLLIQSLEGDKRMMSPTETRIMYRFFKWFKIYTDVDISKDFERFLFEEKEFQQKMNKEFLELTIKTVCQDFKVDVTLFLGRYKEGKYPESRYIAMVALKSKGYCLKDIGLMLGGRHHSTIIHGLRTFRALYQTESNYKSIADSIFKKLNVKI